MSNVIDILINMTKNGTGGADASTELDDMTASAGETAGALVTSAAAFAIVIEAAKALADEMQADVSAAADQQTAFVQLDNTIQSTGRSGEITAAGLDKIAASPLFTTTDIDSAATALARFMDIPSDQIGPDMALVENMAIGLGQTLPEAAQTFGQAMETGRTRGLGFSTEITKQITALMTAGDVQQADAIILDQLTSKYPAASSVLDTYKGETQELAVSIDELRAIEGDGLLPVAEAYTSSTNDAVVAVTKLVEANGEMIDANQFATGVMGNWVTQMRGTVDWTQAQEDQYQALINEYTILANGTNMANTELDKYNGMVSDNIELSKTQGALFSSNADVANTFQTTYNDEIAKGALETTALADATKAATTQEDALSKAVQDKSSWEEMYTSAKDATSRTDDTMKLLGTDIQGILGQTGTAGADVWNGFLAATGQISPAAEQQFVDIESDYNTVQKMLAAGIDTTVVVKWLVEETYAQNNSPTIAPSSVPAPAVPAARSAPNGSGSIYAQAAGGDYMVNQPTLFLAGEAGPERATFTPQGGGGAGGGIIININGAGDPHAVAREVSTMLMAQLNMQGIKTRLT